MESGIARSYGTCMVMGTASTMTRSPKTVGLTLPGASSIPAATPATPAWLRRAGRRIVELIRRT